MRMLLLVAIRMPCRCDAKGAGAGQRGQDSRSGTSGAGQPERASLSETAGAGQPEWESGTA